MPEYDDRLFGSFIELYCDEFDVAKAREVAKSTISLSSIVNP